MNKDGIEEQEWPVVVFIEKDSTEERLIFKKTNYDLVHESLNQNCLEIRL